MSESAGLPSVSAEAGSGEHVGVLVCHGTGQQVPFEAIESVANLRGSASKNKSGRASDVIVRILELGAAKKRLPRAEVSLEKDGAQKHVHVYEAYWAPLTEGKVTRKDVNSFLVDAGFNGVRHCLFEGGL